MPINEREKVGTEKLKISQWFTDYLQTIDDVYKNLEDYNQAKKKKVLIVFDDMIADMESYKKLSPIVTGLFSIERKLYVSLVLKAQSYIKVPKTIRTTGTTFQIDNAKPYL